MPGREPRPGDIYQCISGNKYQVTAIAVDAESKEKCVVYQALYGDFITYVRKYDEFVNEVDAEQEEKQVPTDYEMRELKHPEDEGEVNPDLLAFLEAETTREKIEILDRAQERLTESILCAIEASMDISYENDNLEERIYYIKNYLRTRERYEGTRLR